MSGPPDTFSTEIMDFIHRIIADAIDRAIAEGSLKVSKLTNHVSDQTSEEVIKHAI